MIISRFIRVATNGIISFFFMAEYSIVYIYHNFFIHSSVDGHLGCFHVLAIVNSAAMNTGGTLELVQTQHKGLGMGCFPAVPFLSCFMIWNSMTLTLKLTCEAPL